MKPPMGWDEVKVFYGWNERFAWEGLHIWENQMVVVGPPEGCVFYYDKDQDGIQDPGENARGIRVHNKIAPILVAVLEDIKQANLWNFVTSTAGGYNFRTQRGSSKMSMHSLGAAVDFDPLMNSLGMQPIKSRLGHGPGLGVVRIFEAHGWTWGGGWHRPDPMHFQFGEEYR